MDREHPTVQPQAELHGEEEAPVTEELGDPVPRLSRGPRMGRSNAPASNRRSKPGVRPPGAPSRPPEEDRTPSAAEAHCRRLAYIRPAKSPSQACVVLDASCLTSGVRCILRGAASVGRCLDMHAPRYGIRGRRQEWPSLRTTVPRAVPIESTDYRVAPTGECRLGSGYGRVGARLRPIGARLRPIGIDGMCMHACMLIRSHCQDKARPPHDFCEE